MIIYALLLHFTFLIWCFCQNSCTPFICIHQKFTLFQVYLRNPIIFDNFLLMLRKNYVSGI